MAKDSKVLRSWWIRSALTVVVSIVTAVLMATAFGALVSPSVAVGDVLTYLGIGLLLCATLGDPGWEIQTLHGRSQAERSNRQVQWAHHVLGTFLLAFSEAWAGRLAVFA